MDVVVGVTFCIVAVIMLVVLPVVWSIKDDDTDNNEDEPLARMSRTSHA